MFQNDCKCDNFDSFARTLGQVSGIFLHPKRLRFADTFEVKRSKANRHGGFGAKVSLPLITLAETAKPRENGFGGSSAEASRLHKTSNDVTGQEGKVRRGSIGFLWEFDRFDELSGGKNGLIWRGMLKLSIEFIWSGECRLE